MKNRTDNSYQQVGKMSRRDFMGTAAATAAVIEAYRICDDF